jgi:nitroimidazol reductase NimA-like FMN-containing flavoprotein (pyridoxamine 5'-phosphate oxidase superfamily)
MQNPPISVEISCSVDDAGSHCLYNLILVIAKNVVNIKNQTTLSAQAENIMLEQMKALAKERNMCVLATIASAKPYCSLMAYVADESCEEIYMVTHRKTQKYQNLLENPAVSLLIDTREKTSRTQIQALTIEGTYCGIENETKKKKVRNSLLKNHPHLKEFIEHPDAELICIKIKAFLLLDGLTDSHYVQL